MAQTDRGTAFLTLQHVNDAVMLLSCVDGVDSCTAPAAERDQVSADPTHYMSFYSCTLTVSTLVQHELQSAFRYMRIHCHVPYCCSLLTVSTLVQHQLQSAIRYMQTRCNMSMTLSCCSSALTDSAVMQHQLQSAISYMRTRLSASPLAHCQANPTGLALPPIVWSCCCQAFRQRQSNKTSCNTIKLGSIPRTTQNAVL
jgi:hypothetical protein